MKAIDLRSDTVTRPSPGMRRAMYEAEVGDDVFGDDPTVQILEERVAELFGKEASVFVPSGTMGNQISLKVLSSPGDELLLDENSHIFNYEVGAPAALSGLLVHPLKGERGHLTALQIESHVRGSDLHLPPTRVVAVENTHNRAGGTIASLDEFKRIKQVAVTRQLKLHLDGARLWNASVATGIPLADWAAPFDTVMSCLSKGLGCPVGSMVVGNKETIAKARKVRKLFGGGMRQVGILAAAGLYALEHNFARLAEDHANARHLATGLANLSGLQVDLDSVQTNIVIVDLKPSGKSVPDVVARLREEGVRVVPFGPTRIRAVCHLDVGREDIDKVLEVFCRHFEPIRVPAAFPSGTPETEKPTPYAARRVRADLAELISAFADGRLENEYYLSLRTGRIHLLTDRSSEEERQELYQSEEDYILLPKKRSRDGYQDLLDFIAGVGDAGLKEKLSTAVQGQGAFRRFKDVLLAYPEDRRKWFTFSGERDEARLREWMKENQIALDLL
ncbi:MAG TPA: GntG family PLP-dependent aldolase [Verrucomicrobiae bacterium]|nr:GntG family PLP-dependent aldolase [Verrucomicrobiae bacterium]